MNVSQSSDISPITGNLSFSDGASRSIIHIDVLPDTKAELREMFTVQLTSATGGAKIGTTSSALFTVRYHPCTCNACTHELLMCFGRANDLPHGVIGFSGQQAIINVNEGSAKQSRQLVFGLQRKEGTIGNVQVDFAVTYSQVRRLDCFCHMIEHSDGVC